MTTDPYLVTKNRNVPIFSSPFLQVGVFDGTVISCQFKSFIRLICTVGVVENEEGRDEKDRHKYNHPLAVVPLFGKQNRRLSPLSVDPSDTTVYFNVNKIKLLDLNCYPLLTFCLSQNYHFIKK